MLFNMEQTAASLGILDGRLWCSWLASPSALGSLQHNTFFAPHKRSPRFLDVTSEVGMWVLRIQASGLRMCLASLASKKGLPRRLPLWVGGAEALADLWVGTSQQMLDAGFSMARELSPFPRKEGEAENDPGRPQAVKAIPVRQGVYLKTGRSGLAPVDRPAAYSLWAEVMRAAEEEDPLLRDDDELPRAA